MQPDLVDGTRNLSILSESLSIPGTAAHINWLPPEVLAAIFSHLPKHGPPKRKALQYVRDLVSVTHVCTFWRQVAINAPDLWAKINTRNLEGIRVFLERSGAVPLDVDLRRGLEKEEYHRLLEAVAPHSHRFRQFSAHPPKEAHDPSPFAPFTKAAPLLEKFDITCPVQLQRSILFSDQTPRLRELVVFTRNLWFQNQFGNLTSLHLMLVDDMGSRSEFLPFFNMLRRCPALEEMFIWWNTWDVASTASVQVSPIPLHHLRKLLLYSFCVENIKYLLHTFDLGENEVAVHLSEVELAHEVSLVSIVQTIFANDNSRRLSLASSTKLELIFHTQSRTFILHAVGPNSSIRIDTCLEDSTHCEFTFQGVFSSVKELWVRGTPHWDVWLDGLEHLVALEKLVLNGRGSKLAQNFQEVLSSEHSGTLPCPLLSTIDCYLSTIDCYGDEPEMREVFLLARARSSAGRPLERLRIPSSFLPPPVDVSACVGDVTSLDPPPRPLHLHSMELPEHCFAKDHGWWRTWESRVD